MLLDVFAPNDKSLGSESDFTYHITFNLMLNDSLHGLKPAI